MGSELPSGVDPTPAPDTGHPGTGRLQGSGLPISGGVLAMIVAGAFLLLQKEPLQTSRPRIAVPVEDQAVQARLWQDPFAAVARHRRQNDLADASRGWSFGPAEDGPGIVLGVTVSGGPYDEQAERRLRSRHAVLSALGALGYEPEESEHIGYYVARPLPCLQGRELVVPYEWFRPRAGDPGRLLLLWLKNEAFRHEPLACIADLFEEIAENAPAAELKLIGPYGSTSLRRVAEELTARLTDGGARRAAPEALKRLEIYSPSATIADRLLPARDGRTLDRSFRDWTGSEDSRLLRTIGSDQKLGDVLVEELSRRGVKVGCPEDRVADCNRASERHPEPAHVAIVSEWDTDYGRALPCAFIGSALRADEAPRYPPSCPAPAIDPVDAEPRWIHRFNYLRGLDGQLPLEPGEKKTEEAPSSRTLGGDSEPVERPVGRRRLDYLRRLADQLQRHDAELLRAERHRDGLSDILSDQGRYGLQAIGVLGSDVYDKLLVLQALRERFPHVLFFTTDLDASLLHPAEYRSARNLIVVSNFDLELHRVLQGNIPPFRDNYQTSFFFSTRLALAPDLPRPLTQEEVNAWMSPRVFEIGRSGAFDLSVEPPELPKADPGDVWRWKTDESIHPPRVDHLSRSQPRWLKERLVAAVVLAVVFIRLYRLFYRRYRDGLVDRRSRDRRVDRRYWDRLIHQGHRAHQAMLLGTRALFGLILLAGVLVLAIRVTGQDPAGEPFALFEGISVWPSLFLRYLVGVLALYFVVASWIHMTANDAGLVRKYLPQLARKPRPRRGPRRTWRDLAPLAGFWLPRFFGLRPTWSIWRSSPRSAVARASRKPSGDETAEPPTAARELVQSYLHHGEPLRRVLRVLPLCVLYLVLCRLVILIFGNPNAPYRGEASAAAVLPITVLGAVLPLIFLIFWVVDATRLSVWLTKALADCRAKWPEATRRRVAGALNLSHELVGPWLDIQVIARHSEAVGRLVYFPVIAMILMIASRAPYFDNWDFPLGLCLVISISLLYSIYCAVILRRSAEGARSVALERYSDALIATTYEDPRRAGQIRLLLDQIRNLRVGAFVPFGQQPWVRAVGLLFGGGGSLLLLETFLWLG